MKISKIGRSQFFLLSKNTYTIYTNGVLFDCLTMNVIAFEYIKNGDIEYWEIEE